MIRLTKQRREKMEMKELVIQKIEKIPEHHLEEVLEFIRSLEVERYEKGIGTEIASEKSLKKDWLKPEEDEAWKNL